MRCQTIWQQHTALPERVDKVLPVAREIVLQSATAYSGLWKCAFVAILKI